MTVSSSIRKAGPFLGNGVTTSFPFTFKVFAKTDLQVLKTSAGGVDTALTLDIHYSLTLNSDQDSNPGGTITYPISGSPLAVGEKLTATGILDATQGTDIQNQGGFFPQVIEDRLDYLTILIQQHAEKLARALLASSSDSVPLLTLGTAAQRANRFLTFNSSGDVELAQSLPTGTLSRDSIGQFLYPQTLAEGAAGVTPVSPAYTPTPIDVLRYGIVPNNAGARSANTVALRALLNPATVGPIGRLIFPPVTGADTYYFDGIVEVRNGIRMDLMGCTLDFAKTRTASDNFMGFLSFVKDVSIENGAININYDGTGGINPGMAIRIGSRQGYPFGAFPDGIFDDDDGVEMGNIVLRNLRITSNNPAVAAPVTMIGGLQNVFVENVQIDGGGAHIHGIYYEFGFASMNGAPSTPALWSSSHANNMVFRNVRVTNLNAAGTEGAGIGLIGAGPTRVENLSVDGAYAILEVRPGEAMYYRPWSRDEAGVKRCISLLNVTGRNISSTGMILQGSSDPDATGSGYLKGAGLTNAQKTDLIHFSVDGFSISANGAGISVSGPCDIRNGQISGACASGGLIIFDDCAQFDISDVRIRNGSFYGIRASFSSSIWPTPRKKTGSIRNSQIAGNTTIGISIDNSESVLIENCRIGYSNAADGQPETTQTVGVSVGSAASGVVCRGCVVNVPGGGTAYVSGGTGDRGNSIENARATRSTSGNWRIDGQALASAAQLADKTDVINTASKYFGKVVIENSNNRIYFALGPLATDGWRLADGSVTVTPA